MKVLISKPIPTDPNSKPAAAEDAFFSGASPLNGGAEPLTAEMLMDAWTKMSADRPPQEPVLVVSPSEFSAYMDTWHVEALRENTQRDAVRVEHRWRERDVSTRETVAECGVVLNDIYEIHARRDVRPECEECRDVRRHNEVQRGL